MKRWGPHGASVTSVLDVRRSPRFKTVLRISLYLAAGAVFTLILNYIVVIVHNPPYAAVVPARWPFAVPPGMPAPTSSAEYWTVWSSARSSVYVPIGAVFPTLVSMDARIGFPLRAVQLVQIPPATGQSPRILWPGFLLDSALYGLLVRGFVAFPGALRRRWRSGRDLCPWCAYPIGVSHVCTECGRPVPNRRFLCASCGYPVGVSTICTECGEPVVPLPKPVVIGVDGVRPTSGSIDKPIIVGEPESDSGARS